MGWGAAAAALRTRLELDDAHARLAWTRVCGARSVWREVERAAAAAAAAAPPSPPLPRGSAGEAPRQCRFCLEEESADDAGRGDALVAPCACSGSQRYVHVSCLRRWQRANEVNRGKASVCCVCRQPYSIPPPQPDPLWRVLRLTKRLYLVLVRLGALSGGFVAALASTLVVIGAGVEVTATIMREVAALVNTIPSSSLAHFAVVLWPFFVTLSVSIAVPVLEKAAIVFVALCSTCGAVVGGVATAVGIPLALCDATRMLFKHLWYGELFSRDV